MTDVEKLQAGRVLYDEFNNKVRNGDINQENFDILLNGLKDLGFNSVKEFLLTNRKMSLVESLLCYKRVTKCDGCEGRLKSCYPDCRAAKFYNKLPVMTTESFHSLINDIKASDLDQTDGWFGIYGTYLMWRNFSDNVPPGCSIRFKKVKDSDFDITWRMPMVTTERYEADKKARGE